MISLLYVDDEEVLRYAVQAYLEDSGLKVDTAASGREALEKIKTVDYQAIISDYEMPGMNGIALLKEVRKQHPDLPFLIFTGKGREEVVIEAIENGVDYYLQKGGDVEAQFAELVHKVKLAVRRFESIREKKKQDAMLSSLIDTNPESVLLVNTRGIILAANTAVARRVNKNQSDLLGSCMYDLVPADTAKFRKGKINQAISTRQPVRFEDTWQGRFYDNHIHPIILSDGEVIGAAIHSIDFTDRKYAGKDLACKNEDLQELNEELSASGEELKARNPDTDELQESLQVYRKAIDSSINAIAFSDMEGRITYVNRSFLSLWGYPDDGEVLNRSVLSFWHNPDDAESVKFEVQEKGEWIGELKAVKSDGTLFDAQLSTSVVIDISGRPLCLMASFIDISKRKRAEEELKESEQNLLEAQHIAKMGRLEYDLLTKKLQWSPQTFKIFDIDSTKIEPTYDLFFEMVHPDDREMVNSAYMLSVTEKQPYDNEHRIVLQNGSIKWLQIVCKNEYNQEGLPSRTVGIVQDITRRKKFEERLQKSEKQFRTLFEIVPVPLSYFHRDGVLINFNDRFFQTFGYTRDDIPTIEEWWKRSSPEETIRRQVLETWDSDVKLACEGQTDIFPREYSITRKDGTICTVIISGTITIDIMVITFIDVTERKQALNALKQANRQLNLISGVTRHDIVNKVTALSILFRILRKKIDTSLVEGELTQMDSAIDTIQSQIEFTRLYQDIGNQEPQWQNIKDIISKLYMPEHIFIDIEVEDIEVYADLLIDRVFYNLLDNTMRYGEKVTKIQIYTSKCSESIRIIWEDDGVGIADDEKETIFWRGSGKNTGMGLFFIKEILLITGIDIIEAGKKGDGARFEILVPKNGWRRSIGKM